MRYLIIAESNGSYEDYYVETLGSCFNKYKAKRIVARLTKEDESNIYEYSYEKNIPYKYTGGYKSEKREYKESDNPFLKHIPLDTGNLRFNSIEWDGKAGEIRIPQRIAPYIDSLKDDDKL